MKKLFFIALLAVGMTAGAEEKNAVMANTDTVAAPVVNGDGGVKIADGKDCDDRWSMHFNVGISIPTGAPDGVDFAPFRSWEFGLTAIQYDYTPKKMSKTTFSAGLGVLWRKYTLSGHDKMFVKNGGVLEVVNREGAMADLSSNIHTFAITMPLLIKQRFGKEFAVSVGAQLNWNVHGRSHNDFEIGDQEYDINTKDIGYRPFTVDIMAIVHVCKGLGIYCKYSPMSVLKNGRGPEFRSVSLGFYF